MWERLRTATVVTGLSVVLLVGLVALADSPRNTVRERDERAARVAAPPGPIECSCTCPDGTKALALCGPAKQAALEAENARRLEYMKFCQANPDKCPAVPGDPTPSDSPALPWVKHE